MSDNYNILDFFKDMGLALLAIWEYFNWFGKITLAGPLMLAFCIFIVIVLFLIGIAKTFEFIGNNFTRCLKFIFVKDP